MNKYEEKILRHQNLLNERHQYMKMMLSMSSIDKNYQQSIKYYAALRKRFLQLAQERSSEILYKQGEDFLNNINEQYHNKSAPLARYKIFEKIKSIKNTITQDLINILSPSKHGVLSEAQQYYQAQTKEFANKSEEEKMLIVSHIMSLLSDTIAKNIKLYIRNNLSHNNLAIDYTDLVNKIFIPYIKRAIAEMLFSQELLVKLSDINGSAAAGYLYESEYAKTMQNLYSNFRTLSAGSSNKIYDTVVSFLKTANKKNTINNLDKNLQSLDQTIKNLSVTHQFNVDDVLDEKSKNYIFDKIQVFGIQNKIYDLDYNKADGFNFKKITSNVALLQRFNNSHKHLYSLNYGIVNAAVFLSQFKNTTEVLGRLNVLYAQGTKTIWTTDLIRSILSQGRYLIFNYVNKWYGPEFNATIGTEQLIKI